MKPAGLKYLLVFLLFNTAVMYPQSDTTYTPDNMLEEIADESLIDEEDSQLLDLFEQLSDNPVNLNSASVSDLIIIPFLDSKTSELILNYRKQRGSFYSKYELFSISELDTSIIRKILPFVSTGQKHESAFGDLFSFSSAHIKFRSRVISDLQDRKGYTENRYRGSSLKSYSRLKLSAGKNISAGFLIDKDPGENNYADFYSFNLMIENLSFENRIIFGDYIFEFGKGLAVWSPYSFSKGSDAVGSVSKIGRNIVPYSSADENKFFRGIAASLETGRIGFAGFYSFKNVDARIDSADGFVISLPVDGYHRTESEIIRRQKLGQKSIGISINYSPADFLRLSGMYMRTEFSNEFLPSSVYDFKGRVFNIYSLSYGIYAGGITIGGELAYNGISAAGISNLEFRINKFISFVTSIRNYPHDYYSLYGDGFGEGSSTQNEIGFYNGFRIRSDYGTINFYYDQFKFPYATYYNPVPTSGNEFLFNYSIQTIKNSELIIRYKNENKEVLASINNENIIKRRTIRQIRGELVYSIGSEVRLKTRIEYLSYRIEDINANEEGFLAYQDINYRPFENLQLYCRFIFFDTDSYNSRIYEFENDIPGAVTNSPLYGNGLRWYIMAKYRLSNWLSLAARYVELYKPDEETIGSGLNEIKGNIENKFSLQMDVEL